MSISNISSEILFLRFNHQSRLKEHGKYFIAYNLKFVTVKPKIYMT